MSKSKPKPQIKKNGRPTKYRSEFDEQLVEWMARGHSFESFASQVDAHRSNLYEWLNKHSSFRDAKKKGTMKAMALLESIGLRGMTGKLEGFNVAAWVFMMKCRFRDVYNDQETLPFRLNQHTRNLLQSPDDDD